MRRFYIFIGIFLVFSLTSRLSLHAQDFLDPDDPVINYDSTNPPAIPPSNGIPAKWVRTSGNYVRWNTDDWKAYYYNGMVFRLLFPKSYKTNPTKKYPMLVFFHGEGEKGSIYDNEAQLYNCAQKIQDSALKGTFDGFVLFPQSTYGGWYGSQFTQIYDLINYMIGHVRVDRFRIITNGLSSGGDGCARFTGTYPRLVAACIPMSPTNSGNFGTADYIDSVATLPFWISQGGKDADPNPSVTNGAVQAMQNAGMDIRQVQPGQENLGPESEGYYIVYPNNGHNTWDAHYNEPWAFQYMLRAYKSNPHVVGGQREFCPGTNLSVKLELTPGFTAYQWARDGVVISGATSNTYTVTDTGTYSARIVDGTDTSDWSHWPARITYKKVTITPAIKVAGLMSRVIPAPDGNTSVNLTEPDGYASYTWMDQTGKVVGTSQVFSAPAPGKYVAKVMEVYGCSALPSDSFYVASSSGPDKPDPATDVTGYAVSQTSIQINWSNNLHPVHNETAFEIYRGLKAGGPYQLVGIVPADTVGFLDKGLAAGIRYFYAVRAVDSTSASALSSEDSIVTFQDHQAPSAPANISLIAATDNSVTLSWNSAVDNVGVKNYLIYVNGVKSFIITDTSFTVYNLQHGKSYTFYVKATDPTGNVSPASSQLATTATYQGLTYNYYTYTGSWSSLPDFSTLTAAKTGLVPNVTLSPATQPTNYAFSYQGHINIRKAGTYTFYISSDDGSKLYINNTLLLKNDGLHGVVEVSGTYTFNSPGEYPFRVEYYQGGGGAALTTSWQCVGLGISKSLIPDSVFIESAALNGQPPAFPTNITAKAISYHQVNVSWQDKSSDETGFEVYRTTGTGAPWKIVYTTGPNVTSMSDSTVSPATTYLYKVQAINLYGASGFDPASIGGLNYSYYESSTGLSTMPDFNSMTPVKTGVVPNITLSVKNRTSNYAIDFSGVINIPVTGKYTFYTASDDGSMLYIGSQDAGGMVVNNNYAQAPTERSGDTTLTAGIHNIYMTFFQGGGGDSLSVSYQGPGIAKQYIPDSVFSNGHSRVTTPPLPIAPKAPHGLAIAAVSTTTVLIKWVDSSNNETGFNIYRSDGDSTSFRRLGSVSANTTDFSDKGLYANTMYYYKVEAAGLGGSSTFSNIVGAYTANPTQAIYINFNGSRYSEGGYWNNTNDENPNQGDVYQNMKDSLGNITAVGLSILSAGLYSQNAGTPTGTNSGIYPDNVIESGYWTVAGHPVNIKINGLDPNGTYNFSFFGNVYTSPRLGSYQIGSQVVTLNPTYNISNTASINGVHPDEAGSIVLTINAAGKTPYGYLTAMVIRGAFTPVDSVPLVPVGLTAAYNTSVVSLNWVDPSNNEKGFDIYRKAGAALVYSKIGSVGANVTAYDDPSLTPSTHYSYKIKAFNDNGSSAFSDSVLVITPAAGLIASKKRAIYINFNGSSSAAGGYWNNTNDQNPVQGDTYGNMKDTTGQVTGVGIKILSGVFYVQYAGTPTGNNSGVYPDKVINSAFWNYAAQPGNIQVYGLNPHDTYNFIFFANVYTTPRLATFQLGNRTVTLNPTYNTTKTVSIDTVHPDENGTATFTVKAASGTPYGYITSLVIREFSLAPPPVGGIALRNIVSNDSTLVKVKWTASSADTFKVYRSSQRAGNYSLLNQGMVNGSDSSYVDSTVQSNSTYYYYIKAVSSSGSSDPSDTVGITTPPIIQTVNNFSMPEGGEDTVHIMTKGGDYPVTLRASNLPSFGHFTDSLNGRGSVVLAPPSGIHGDFEITVTASNNQQDSSSTSFSIHVTDTSTTTIFVNFNGTQDVASPWNNTSAFSPRAGQIIADLKDTAGLSTGISLSLLENWSSSNTSGAVTGDNSGVFPDSVMRTAYWDQSGADRHIKLSGLAAGRKYNFTLFGSNSGTGNKMTVYSVGVQKDSMNVANNTSQVIRFNEVQPDPSGAITITVNSGATSSIGYVNALVIKGYDSAMVSAPEGIKAVANSTSKITLTWANAADHVSGTEIWRAGSSKGDYTLVATVSGDTTGYTDANLSSDTRYFYKLKTIRYGKTPDYSAIASATTMLYSVYINFDQNTPAPSPWNNLNTVPNIGNVFGLTDENGNSTGINLEDMGGFSGVNPWGVITGDNSGVYPDNVISSTYWVDASDTGKLAIHGLNLSMSYSLTFFGSRTGTGDRTTQYIANGKVVSLQTANDTMVTVTIPNVVPDKNGNINIGVTPGGKSPYAYIGALVVQAHNNYDDNGNIVYDPSLYMYNRQMPDGKMNMADSTRAFSYRILNAYPNPFGSYVDVVISAQQGDHLIFSLTGTNGVTVDRRDEAVNEGVNTIHYKPAEHVLSGFYILTIRSATTGKMINVKLIKK